MAALLIRPIAFYLLAVFLEGYFSVISISHFFGSLEWDWLYLAFKGLPFRS